MSPFLRSTFALLGALFLAHVADAQQLQTQCFTSSVAQQPTNWTSSVSLTKFNPNLGTLELMGHVRGPDFPTGGMILGREGIFQAFDTGRGSIITRGKVHIEEQKNNREWIVIDEIPYMVNKASLVQKIAALVKEKRLEGISDLRDESSRDRKSVV